MKTFLVLAPLGAAALLFASTAASAQSARFSDIDRDGNGRLSYQELERAFGRSGADRVWSRNGGNDLTRQDASRIYSDRDDDDDDGDDDDDDDGRRGGLNDDDDDGFDDDDDDGRGGGFDDDENDDDGGSGGGGGDDDDDDDGGSSGGGGGDDDDDD